MIQKAAQSPGCSEAFIKQTVFIATCNSQDAYRSFVVRQMRPHARWSKKGLCAILNQAVCNTIYFHPWKDLFIEGFNNVKW